MSPFLPADASLASWGGGERGLDNVDHLVFRAGWDKVLEDSGPGCELWGQVLAGRWA